MAKPLPAPALAPSCLYPSERELALLILGKERANQWPAFAIVEERHGLPPIDQLLGGRYWPEVEVHLKRRSARVVPAATLSHRATAWEPALDASGVDLATPGLHGQIRPGGRIDYYWRPSPRLSRAGCPMKSVRVLGDTKNARDLPGMAAICQRLQAELLAWAPNAETTKSRFAPGTLGYLCDTYESGTDSPTRELRHSTQKSYARFLRLLTTRAGDQKISGITGRMIRGWFAEWRAERSHRDAYGCVQVLRIVANFGTECAVSKDDPCFFLTEVLRRMEFEQPKGRTVRPTFEMVNKLIEEARASEAPSVALACMLQFELSLRPKDVIGEWVPVRAGEKGAPVSKRWEWGLTWDQIDENWILRKPTSKSNGRLIAEHDLRHHPALLVALESVPADQRKGAIVINEKTRLPYRKAYFSKRFRELADKSGWPKNIWNMDTRAGAISEAFEAGATSEDIMKLATHTQISTTIGYNRGAVVQSSRVAQLRSAKRNSASASAEMTPEDADGQS